MRYTRVLYQNFLNAFTTIFHNNWPRRFFIVTQIFPFIYRPFATRVSQLKNLAFLSYWYRKKRLQMHFEQVQCHNASVEITNKMQPCNRIYYSNVYWRLNMFRAAHHSSSGALNCICSLWFTYTCVDRPLSRLSGKNTVYSSWWWAVCRSKHVEPSINVGIINSITRLHLVGYFYWFILRCTYPWILKVTVQFAKLAAGEQLCRRCTHSYNSQGRGFDSRLRNWDFSLT